MIDKNKLIRNDFNKKFFFRILMKSNRFNKFKRIEEYRIKTYFHMKIKFKKPTAKHPLRN